MSRAKSLRSFHALRFPLASCPNKPCHLREIVFKMRVQALVQLVETFIGGMIDRTGVLCILHLNDGAAGLFHRRVYAGSHARQECRAQGWSFVHADGNVRIAGNVGLNLPPDFAARRRRRRRAPAGWAAASASMISNESRRPYATPSRTARATCVRSVRRVRPNRTPRAFGSAYGARSPVR